MKKYKLACFDLDGTLVDGIRFSWQMFHNHFQTDSHKREDAMSKFFNKEISYVEWAEHDMKMWLEKNPKKEDFFEAMKNIRLMDGAMETLNELKKRGLKLALISGSINIVLEKVIPNYEDIFDDVFISRIFFGKNGYISGIQATEYDLEGKAIALKQIAEREKIPLDECVYVGDYLNDIKIMEQVGLGIAFNCEHEELKKVAKVVIEKKDLREILSYIS